MKLIACLCFFALAALQSVSAELIVFFDEDKPDYKIVLTADELVEVRTALLARATPDEPASGPRLEITNVDGSYRSVELAMPASGVVNDTDALRMLLFRGSIFVGPCELEFVNLQGSYMVLEKRKMTAEEQPVGKDE